MSRRGSSVKKRKEMNGVIIDPLASVHPTAEFESGVRIGPYSVIGENVRIGRDTQIASHVVIGPWTTLGRECNVFQFASVGAPPQDLGYKGEKTEVILGDNNVIREFVTIHRATTKAARKTVCGNNNLFMNYVHVAHDCMLGNDIIMANAATLAGHVTIEDHAIVGGIVAVHQFVRIGPTASSAASRPLVKTCLPMSLPLATGPASTASIRSDYGERVFPQRTLMR